MQSVRTSGIIFKLIIASHIIIIGAIVSPLFAVASGSIVIRNSRWTIRVDPARLGLWCKTFGADREITLASPSDTDEPIEGLKVSRSGLSWRIPQRELTVEIRLSEAELSVRFTTPKEQTLEWPATGDDPQAIAVIYPESEGLYIPVRDPFWLEHIGTECRDTEGGVMPFWGFQFERATVAYLLPNDLRNQLCFDTSRGRLSLKTSHRFIGRDGMPAYEVKIVLAKSSPIGPALAYRDWLVRTGRHVSFAEKVRRVPEARKLLGAMHAYLWGDGRTKAAVEELKRVGVDRACLLYDQDPRRGGSLVNAETIEAAKSLGFLIGPYDTFSSVEDPKTANSSTSIYDEELYRTGGVMRQDGKRQQGFAGFGYTLSSEALRRAMRPFIEERVDEHIRSGVNSYFVDADAAGELYDDYDPLHPMTTSADRENRLARLRFIGEQKKLVLGLESAAAWSSPVIHFSHGTFTPKSALLWRLLKNRELFGGFWPPERPLNRFKTIDAPQDFATFTYDPKYRIPLYEAVFHDSVIATDFWGLPLMKFDNLVRVRSLLMLLYNVPSMWHLDRRAIREYGERIKALNDFFAPLHRRVGGKPLTSFEWLTPDRMVQQTQFGEDIEMTANFGERAFGRIPPLCVEAHWFKEARRNLFCPSPR